MCQCLTYSCVCVCVTFSSYLTTPHMHQACVLLHMRTRTRTRTHTHTHTHTEVLKFFYISLNCNNMRHFMTTITFRSKVITLVVCTLNLSFVTLQLTQSLCI